VGITLSRADFSRERLTIQELAGHSDISTTMRYIHLVDAKAHDAIRQLTKFTENELADCHKKGNRVPEEAGLNRVIREVRWKEN
jgi:hypothetical protein